MAILVLPLLRDKKRWLAEGKRVICKHVDNIVFWLCVKMDEYRGNTMDRARYDRREHRNLPVSS